MRGEINLTTLELALNLAEKVGAWVFPVAHNEVENTKKPLTPNGHLDATQDPGVIEDWWKKWPNAKVGVFTGKSGLNICDVDTKNGKDGWEDLAERWYEIPETFSYDTGTGGTHLVYAAPEGLELFGNSEYRDMPGVDRRAGSSWAMWVGECPEGRSVFKESPEWLNDEKPDRKQFNFEGDLQEWYDSLVPGEPNAIVRHALGKVNPDMSHSDMVAAQHHAIRLGAEGNTGVPELLDALAEAWQNRPAENHTTPESEWEFKFNEALESGLVKYGAAIDMLKNLPEYSIGLVPEGIPDSLVLNDTGKPGYSKLLAALVNATDDNDKIASILWNAPATKALARDWGLELTHRRIAEARVKPEPTRENPRLEEKREEVEKGDDGNLDLLTAEEKEYLSSRPSFVQHIQSMASDLGYDQMGYFEAAAWNMASLAFGMKGFVPVSATQRHGVNLWQIVPGGSGTGKSVVDGLQTDVLDYVMYSEAEVPYDLGADSSIQGLHMALLQRDGVPSLFAADEASGWFKRLKVNDWATGLEDTLADWYMGRVSGSNKISLKELRGKSARTSFNLFMFATPDRLMETLTRDQFMSGFLARVMWTFGNPRQDSDEMFDIFKESSEEVEDASVAPSAIQGVSADLVTARSWFQEPVVLKPTTEAKKRMSDAYRKMYRTLQDKRNWDVIEPALTRHMESMLKAAGVCAMYRGDSKIDLDDALHAVRALEGWVKNLVQVADLVSAGDFQRRADELEAFLRQVGGTTSGAKIYHRFKNWIVRDSKEIENVITYLVQSGIINKDDSNGGIRYSLNGE